MSFLDDYAVVQKINDAGTNWLRYDVTFTTELTSEGMAKKVAALVMETRCPPTLYNKWLDAFEGRAELDNVEKEELEVYIRPSIGLRGAPASDTELQAVVAEYLWYEAVRNQVSDYELVDIYKPSLRVTESGGDGLVIYQTDYSSYIFRLWEVKKHDSIHSATSKITSASKQLRNKGAEYLAKWSVVGQGRDHEYPGLSEFYAELVGKWIAADNVARAGVSVSKDVRSAITNNPISIMRRHLPRLVGADQLTTIVVSVPGFVEFTKMVREALWKDI